MSRQPSLRAPRHHGLHQCRADTDPARSLFDVAAFDAPAAHGGSVARERDGGGEADDNVVELADVEDGVVVVGIAPASQKRQCG